MVISITSHEEAIVCANNMLLGKVSANESVSLPLTSGPVLLCAYPLMHTPCCWCYLFCEENKPRILPCNARLSILNDELAHLELLTYNGFNQNSCSPPIVTNEARWSGAICGICEGWFVVQTSDKTLYYNTRGVLSFKILNELFVLLTFSECSVIIDRTLSARLQLSNGEISLSGNTIEEIYSSFSFFKLKRTFDSRSLQLISSNMLALEPRSSFETICCFCEAVRLGLSQQALSFMTPSLAQTLDFDSIREFLGPFDKIEKPRFFKAHSENAFCLRYAFDEYNFHYICYEVEFDKSTGCDLIDNISEA